MNSALDNNTFILLLLSIIFSYLTVIMAIIREIISLNKPKLHGWGLMAATDLQLTTVNGKEWLKYISQL